MWIGGFGDWGWLGVGALGGGRCGLAGSVSEVDVLTLVRLVAAVADHQKGSDTVIIDVGDVLAVSDFFVITSASSSPRVAAIVGEIEARVCRIGGPTPDRIEGLGEREWVLMDYGAFVVHVFRQSQRDFYRLERLWQDCPQVNWVPLKAGS